jgi:DNA (cytosine-5)-methyltransferase 1
VDYTKKSPAVLSLCSGYGGIELGLERVFGRIRTLAYVEIEAFAIANLVDKMEAGQMVPAAIWTDVKTLNAGVFRGKVDILTGGYPCQPFSAAGKRLGADDPRHLWPHIERIIDDCEPDWCFFENVEGHISLGLCEVLASLENRGYKAAWGIFSAAEVGAPHQRKRVFILAHSCHARSGYFFKPIRCEAGAEVLRQKDGPECSVRANTADSNKDMAYCCGIGGAVRLPRSNEREEGVAKELNNSCCRNRWPASPGEEQCEWEEPRVVADTRQCGGNGGSGGADRRGWICGDGTQDIWAGGGKGAEIKAKPQLGGAVDGVTRRVDRLRLLGNGVMPATAAKAFVALHDELMDEEIIEPKPVQMTLF